MKQILGLATIGLILFTMYEQNEKINEMKTAVIVNSKAVDSLQTELFNLQVTNGIYEASLEHLKEVDPKAMKELQHYINTETE